MRIWGAGEEEHPYLDRDPVLFVSSFQATLGLWDERGRSGNKHQLARVIRISSGREAQEFCAPVLWGNFSISAPLDLSAFLVYSFSVGGHHIVIIWSVSPKYRPGSVLILMCLFLSPVTDVR